MSGLFELLSKGSWSNSGLIFFSAVTGMIFFVLGLLLGRRWRKAAGGQGGSRRPDFRKQAFPGGNRPPQGQPSQPPPRRDGPVELYVGNMALETTREDVEKEFGKHGKVLNIRLIAKPAENKSFGFVEMGSQADADAAIKALAGNEFLGNVLEVNVAKSPRSHNRRRRH